MYHAFPGVDQAGVETLATIPNIGIVIGLLISPFLIRFIGEKATILTGLVVTLLSGTFPMYATAYTPILISRFLIGAGIGLFNSLAVSLIPQFYGNDEEELATMVGYQNVMGGLGAAIASFLISYLITISWHAAFAIYFLVIPVLILFTIFMFFIFLFYMPMSFKIPAFVVEEKLGTVSELLLLTGILNLVSIPVGASFGFFFKRLHDKIFPIGFLILGIGFGLSVPYMYNWLDWSAPKNSVNLATTIVLVLVNVGCAISPMVLNAITSSAKMCLLVSAIFFGCFTIYAFIHYLRAHKN